jgi:hypothetical protein
MLFLLGHLSDSSEIFEVLNVEIWAFTPCATVKEAENMEMAKAIRAESLHCSSECILCLLFLMLLCCQNIFCGCCFLMLLRCQNIFCGCCQPVQAIKCFYWCVFVILIYYQSFVSIGVYSSF